MAIIFSATTARGKGRVPAAPGDTLARALFRAGFFVGVPLCAGLGRCGRCQVRFLRDAPLPLPAERRRLSGGALADGWRLACLHPARGGEALALADTGPAPAYDRLAGPAPVSVAGPVGLAVDCGTTGLAWRVVSLADGRVAAEGRGVNPQLGAGTEVVSRLAFALEPGGGAYLRRLVIDELLRMAALAGPQLSALCVAGNPAMLSILCDKPLAGLARAPYGLAWRAGETVDLGSGLPPAYVPPFFGPFVGADIAAGLAVLTRQAPAYPFMLVDLGTNAEMVLALGPDRFLAASAPLGPALEGVGLSQGAMAGPGVAVAFDLTPGGLVPVFFGGGPAPAVPKGIAGPGYLSLAARLREQGVLDVDGRFATTPAATPLGRRLAAGIGNRHGEPSFVTAGCRLPASDVEELLKVKAACNLAFSSLLAAGALTTAQLASVHLAGAFGTAVSPGDLETLGFFPPGLAGRTHVAGNLSLEGAALFLTDPASREQVAALAAKTAVVPLVAADDAGYAFIQRMVFSYVP
ncbi:ASKHA domain-containing protein [Desulfovibrio sp. DV]|uniref:ASKHA domain-containing protein n=1 Tax=Desulfovibrio sp. DV TaxID=1844708 RepID=UPI00094BAB5D|nr:ASKHA domain-containing protein [Desulfovibrio sp. DV]